MEAPGEPLAFASNVCVYKDPTGSKAPGKGTPETSPAQRPGLLLQRKSWAWKIRLAPGTPTKGGSLLEDLLSIIQIPRDPKDLSMHIYIYNVYAYIQIGVCM